MKRAIERPLEAYLVRHFGVLTRIRAVELGLSPAHIDHLLREGRWRALYRGVYRASATADPAAAQLYAATLATGPGSVASSRSAAHLWQLADQPPAHPEITLPRTTGGPRTPGVLLHRRGDLDPARTVLRMGLIPVTDPLRTIIDLGGVIDAAALDRVIDRGIAAGLVSADGLLAEAARLGRPGRCGPNHVRRALERRGMAEPPEASVLESEVLRLLRSWGIVPLAVEASVFGGRYRLDILLRPGLALEVDGYTYHWSPEAMADDYRRRNLIQATGITIILATWFMVKHQPAALRREVEEAIRAWDRKARIAG